jgi:alpha-ketoglutaric semialdehyde dehydrogenase
MAEAALRALNPATNEHAFDTFRETTPEVRAKLLESIADKLIAAKDEIVERAMQEAGLPRPRIEGELGRTAGQLRLFAGVLRDGSYLDVRIDPAMPERAPLPRPDLRMRNIPLGPVAVFGASNFPLAFSVAGGDTASALAAGCPVVAKGHSAHLGTSELVGRAVQAAVAEAGLPEGVFSLVYDAGFDVGQALVAHPAIKAVGFTGSRRGGEALLRTAQARPEPIPVYAEMSAVNPVILFPHALAAFRGEAIAKNFVGALTLGAATGQFCTNPGLILARCVGDGPRRSARCSRSTRDVQARRGVEPRGVRLVVSHCSRQGHQPTASRAGRAGRPTDRHRADGSGRRRGRPPPAADPGTQGRSHPGQRLADRR